MIYIGAAIGYFLGLYVIYFILKSLFRENVFKWLWGFAIAKFILDIFDYFEAPQAFEIFELINTYGLVASIYIMEIIELKKTKINSSMQTQDFEYAPFFKRLLASMIDGVIILTINIIVQFLWRVIYALNLVISQKPIEFPNSAWMIFLALILILYWPLFESSKLKATPGKLLLKLSVLQINGDKFCLSKALERNLYRFFTVITFFVGYLSMLGHPLKQTWHDEKSKSFVVKKLGK